MKSLLRLIAMAFAAATLFAGPALAGNTKLFVSNVAFRTSEADLRDAFSAYGAVLDASIMMDKETGKPRGYAIVAMHDPAAAEAAITGLNGKELHGRILGVKVLAPIDARRPGSFSDGGGGDRRFANAPKKALWAKCADENGTCTLKARQIIRYGANGTFVTKTDLTGVVVCNNATFGDPLPSVAKICEVR